MPAGIRVRGKKIESELRLIGTLFDIEAFEVTGKKCPNQPEFIPTSIYYTIFHKMLFLFDYSAVSSSILATC